MHKVKNADFEEYRKYRIALQEGKILTPDALKLICKANDNDPTKIGTYMLELLAKFNLQ